MSEKLLLIMVFFLILYVLLLKTSITGGAITKCSSLTGPLKSLSREVITENELLLSTFPEKTLNPEYDISFDDFPEYIKYNLQSLNKCFKKYVKSNMLNPKYLIYKVKYNDYYYDYDAKDYDKRIVVNSATLPENLLIWNKDPIFDETIAKNSFINYLEDPIFTVVDDDSASFFNSINFTRTDVSNDIMKAFSAKQIEYITFFQYYAHTVVYSMFVPEWHYLDTDFDSYLAKVEICEKITKDNAIIFPICCKYGLYVSLFYDKRFGIIVASKGTEDRYAWLNNISKDGIGTRIIINNFHHILNCIRDLCESYRKSTSKTIRNIAFTGHSLGGAISQQLAAIFLHNKGADEYFREIEHIHLVTFNSAGVTPIFRDFSVKVLQNTHPAVKLNHVILRRDHDLVHQTGCAAFQNKNVIRDIYTDTVETDVDPEGIPYSAKVSKITGFDINPDTFAWQDRVNTVLIYFGRIYTNYTRDDVEESITNTLYRKIGLKTLASSIEITNPEYYGKLGATILFENHTRPFFSCEEKLSTFLKYDSQGKDLDSLYSIISELNIYTLYNVSDTIRDYFSSTVKQVYNFVYRKTDKPDISNDGVY